MPAKFNARERVALETQIEQGRVVIAINEEIRIKQKPSGDIPVCAGTRSNLPICAGTKKNISVHNPYHKGYWIVCCVVPPQITGALGREPGKALLRARLLQSGQGQGVHDGVKTYLTA